MRSTWLAVLTAGFVLLAPNGASAQSENESGMKCPKKVRVLVKKVETGTFYQYKHFAADFHPKTAVAKTMIAGTVTDIKVSDGDLVSEGFVLIMLNEGLEEEARKAEAELARWKKILWNREHWKERSPNAEAQAKRKIAEAQTQLDEAKAAAPKASVPAPISGTVELMVVPGTEVEAGAEVAKVTDRRLKVAKLEVDADDLGLFPVNGKIELGDGMTAVVARVEDQVVCLNVADPADRFGDGSKSFKLLKREESDAVILSQNRILQDDAGTHVFVVSGKNARRADIAVDAQYEGNALVTAGLEAGDLIITQQVLNRKSGETTDSLACLEDGKRIRVMVKDPETGRLVKFTGELPTPPPPAEEEVEKAAEPDTEPEPVQDVEQEVAAAPKEAAEWSPSLGIGVGVGVAMMSDEVFKDVYGSNSLSLDFRLVYAFHPRVEGFLNVAYSTKTGTIIGVDAETEIIRAPISLGARYVFAAGSKFKPYVGLAAIAFNAKETNVYVPDAGYITRWGFGLVGGVYYEINPKLDLFLDLRYGFGTHNIEDFEDEAKLDTLRLHLGIVYRIGL